MKKWTNSLKGIIQVEILEQKDFEGYERNKPNDRWELVRFPDNFEGWISKKQLHDTKDAAKGLPS